MNGLIGSQSNHSGTNLSVVSTGDSGQKRRRVGLACGVCRTRKSRVRFESRFIGVVEPARLYLIEPEPVSWKRVMLLANHGLMGQV